MLSDCGFGRCGPANDLGDFGAPGKGTVAVLMLLMGVGLGWGLYRTFSPAERRRRMKVADARKHATDVASACRKQVQKARDDVERVRRGEAVEPVPLEPCHVVAGRGSSRWDSEIEDI